MTTTNCSTPSNYSSAPSSMSPSLSVDALSDYESARQPVTEATAAKRHKMLIFVNPASGRGKALSIFEKRVRPILSERPDIDYEVVTTTAAGGALDYVRSHPSLAATYQSIVVVSGDGLLHEVVNGIMQRSDCEAAIKIPIGVVPGGSGNGLAHSVNYAINNSRPNKRDPVVTSTMNILSRRPVPMDLVRIKARGSTYWSFLSLGWGLMADIDIESECLRLIGEARFTVWGVVRLCSLRRYHGKLSYIPHPNYDATRHRAQLGSVKSQTANIKLHNQIASTSIDRRNSSGSRESLGSSAGSSSNSGLGTPASRASLALPADRDAHFAQHHSNQSAVRDELKIVDDKSKWVTLERDFVLVYAVYQTHIGSDVIFAPEAKFNDGAIWLVYLTGDVTRRQAFQFLTSLESGRHLDFPFVHVLPVIGLSLAPTDNCGRLTLDGELIPTSPIEAEVLPGIARLIVK